MIKIVINTAVQIHMKKLFHGLLILFVLMLLNCMNVNSNELPKT